MMLPATRCTVSILTGLSLSLFLIQPGLSECRRSSYPPNLYCSLFSINEAGTFLISFSPPFYYIFPLSLHVFLIRFFRQVLWRPSSRCGHSFHIHIYIIIIWALIYATGLMSRLGRRRLDEHDDPPISLLLLLLLLFFNILSLFYFYCYIFLKSQWFGWS